MLYQLAFVKNIFFRAEVASGGNLVLFVYQIVYFFFAERRQGVKQFFSIATATKAIVFVFGDG